MSAGVFAVAACADLPVANVDIDVSYVPGEELAGGNNTPVIIIGNPFPIPQPEFTADAIDAMQGWAFGPNVFVPATDPNAVYRVIVMFDPSNNVIGQTLCTRPPTAQPLFGVPPGRTAPLSAALCRGDKYLAHAWGTVPTGDGPRSETFRTGFGRFIRTLFPAQNPQRRPSRPCMFGRC